MDVYAEVLRWQKQMQDKSTEEAQIVLNSNLEQIAKVELLSFLSIFLVLLSCAALIKKYSRWELKLR